MEILTSLLVIITAIYAYLTYKIARVNEQALKVNSEQVNALYRPYLFFNIIPKDFLVSGEIKNTGTAVAYKIRLRVTPTLYSYRNSGKIVLNISSKDISILPPGEKITEFIGTYADFKKDNAPLVYECVLEYEGINGKKYEEKFKVDLSYRETLAYIAETDLPDEIKKIRELLERSFQKK